MEKLNINLKGVISILGGITYILFGNDTTVIHSLVWLLYLMGIDMVTGFIKGNMQGKGNSKDLRAGILKKIINIVFISFCYHVDVNLGMPFSLAQLSIGTFSAMEGYSVVENFIALGVPVPDKMKNMFLVSKEGDSTNGK